MSVKHSICKVEKFGISLIAISALLLAGCGGGSGSSAPAASTLSGVAAVGSPIANGTINVICTAGGAPTITKTNSTGAWQVTLYGQTLPCAVEVSGGTINDVANTTPYHSIATVAGTVNVTPLTDLLVANLAGTATPSIWFAGLSTSSSTLTTIKQADVDAALTRLGAALNGLPISANNPITTAFTPTSGNVSDNMLAALKTAMANSGVSYATLLSNASLPAFNSVTGFGTALTNAYAGSSGGASGGSTAGTLTVTFTSNGVALPQAVIQNAPKPVSQAAFCSDAIVQSAYGSVVTGGTLTISSCLFNGASGSISIILNKTTPVAMAVLYTVNYFYY